MKSFKKGETIQVWDWWAAENNREYDNQTLKSHGSLGIVVRKSRATDTCDNGHELGKSAKHCYLVAIIGEGLKSYSADWLRYPENIKDKKS